MAVQVLDDIRRFVKEYLSKHDASHDWLHIERVVTNAMKIAKMESKSNSSIDMMIVEMAALLHDVGDYKYSKE